MIKRSEERFKKHLPKSRDVTLIVLKGHLLIEEEVNELLDVLLKNPRELYAADLRFYQKICLLKALFPGKDLEEREWTAIEKLNSIRNKLAHKLEPPKIEALIKDFLKILEDPDISESEYEKESTDKRLKRNIAFLCGILSGLKEGIKAVKTPNKALQPTAKGGG